MTIEEMISLNKPSHINKIKGIKARSACFKRTRLIAAAIVKE
jgi:hypothetical protein